MQHILLPKDQAAFRTLLGKLTAEDRRYLEEAIKSATETSRREGLEAGRIEGTQALLAAHQRGQREGKIIGTIQIFCRLLCQPGRSESYLAKLSVDELQVELSQILQRASRRGSG